MKRVELTQGMHALIDDEDYLLVNQYNWCVLQTAHRHWVAVTGPNKKTEGKLLYMHRLIMNIGPGQQVDHREHYEDYIDNQKSNLRLCTNAENQYNQRKQLKKTSSQYKGVHWNKQRCKWQVRINVNRKTNHLGLFIDEDEAARTYNVAAIEHFGEFAKLNEVRNGL